MTVALDATVALDVASGVAAAALAALAACLVWARRAVGAAEARDRAANRRADTAEAELAALSEATAGVERVAHRHDRALETLWELAELGHARQRSDQVALTPGACPPGGPGLSGALQLLVERVREEAGIPGELRVELSVQPHAADALIVLQTMQALLDAVARRCDHFAIDLRDRPGRLVAVVLGNGFDGGQGTVEDARSMARLLRGVGVDATVAAAGGNIEAELAFPVPPPG